MSVVDDPKTYGRARLSFASEADIDEFASVLGQFERGEIGPDQWRVFRLVRGPHRQRQAEGAPMPRGKIPPGGGSGAPPQAPADAAGLPSRRLGPLPPRPKLPL